MSEFKSEVEVILFYEWNKTPKNKRYKRNLNTNWHLLQNDPGNLKGESFVAPSLDFFVVKPAKQFR